VEDKLAARKARVAVIGTGWWSTYAHIPSLRQNSQAELVAFCDSSPEALERAVAAFGPLKTYRDYRELLAAEKLDGVVIAVNHAAHYEVAKACLEAGLHVLLEKPMVLRAAHAHELLQLAQAHGVELIVGYPYHFTELTRQARAILASGELGAIQLVSCLMSSMVIEFYRGNDQAYQPIFQYPVTGPGRAYADRELSGGGQGHLQITHAAGSLFYITGLQAERVSCYMENGDVAVDLVDALSVRFQPANGQAAVGVIGSTGNLGLGDAGRLELSVFCEKGYLLLEQVQGTLLVRRHDGTDQRFGPLPDSARYPHLATAANLVDVILGRAANGSPATFGARVVELLEAAYRSAASAGQPVRVADLD
jgi:predicted dehydrogenase